MRLRESLPFVHPKVREIPAAEFDAFLKSAAMGEEEFETFVMILGATPWLARDWASGATPIPRERTAQIEAAMEAERRDAAAREAGLPMCAKFKELEDELVSLRTDIFMEVIAQARRIEAHAESCPVCRARQAFLDKRFGTVKPRLPWWKRPFGLQRIVAPLPLPSWAPKKHRFASRTIWASLQMTAIGAAILGVPAIFSGAVRRELGPILTTALIPGAATFIAAMGLAAFAGSWIRSKFHRRVGFASMVGGVATVYTLVAVFVAGAVVFWGAHPFTDFAVMPFARHVVALTGLGAMFGFQRRDPFEDYDAIETVPSPSQLPAAPPTPEASNDRPAM